MGRPSAEGEKTSTDRKDSEGFGRESGLDSPAPVVFAHFPTAADRKDSAGWAPTVDAVETLTRWVQGWTSATGMSRRAAAMTLGCDEKTLRNYLAGVRVIPPTLLSALPPIPDPTPGGDASA